MVDALPMKIKENEMKKFGNIALLSALSLLVLCLPAVASAQWGGYGGGYGGNIKGTVQSLKYHAKSFEGMTDRYSDRNDGRRWGGNSADRIEDLADDFSKAASKLEDKYGNGRNLNNSRSAAQNVLGLASRIDQVLSRGGSQQLYGMWNQMRGELNIIARTYGLSYYGRGGMNRPNNYPNNRNRRTNNRRIRLPFPF